MTPERYQALLRWLETRPALKKLVIALNRWLPAVPFACYPLLLVPKETHGKSFPSRHALSAAVLAAVWCYFYPAAGACMVVVALLICALRVLAGAHYVRDVAAGALLGFALGAAGMWLL